MLSIVPGLGQIYSKRIGDGIVALCMVAVSGYCTYYYYKKDNKFMTITFSILDIFFYSGNLYGAYNSARKYNSLSQNYRVSELKDIYWEELE